MKFYINLETTEPDCEGLLASMVKYQVVRTFTGKTLQGWDTYDYHCDSHENLKAFVLLSWGCGDKVSDDEALTWIKTRRTRDEIESRQKFTVLLENFKDAANELSANWNPIGNQKGYPFPESFDEVSMGICTWFNQVYNENNEGGR